MKTQQSLVSGDVEFRLESCYRGHKRRIAGESALQAMGMPLTVGLEANSAARPDDEQTSSFCIAHTWENVNTVEISAFQVSERTFISSPERAILEIAEGKCAWFSLEALVRALSYDILHYDTAGMLTTAEKLGFWNGARRILSIGNMLKDEEGLRGNMVDLMSAIQSSVPNTDLIPIDPRRMEAEEEFFDAEFNVTWHEHPKSVYAHSKHCLLYTSPSPRD